MHPKDTAPVFPNYREALRAAFGDSADNIPGVDPTVGTLQDVPVYGLRVVLNVGPGFHHGRAFVSCGMAEVFGVMRAASEATKLVFYLVRDDADGRAWERRRVVLTSKPSIGWTEAEVREYHTPRPSAQYRVVSSI